MFNNIKKKLNSALQNGLNITENIQQQYKKRVNLTQNFFGSNTHHQHTSTELSAIPQNVNVAAGCKLLAKYEDDWAYIHKNNEENAQKAKQLAKKIGDLEQQLTKHQITIIDLLSCTGNLPNLVQQLKACQMILTEVENLYEIVVIECDKLEDICEECELQEFMWQKQIELTKYKQKKMDELELYRQQVAHKHFERIRQHEEKLKRIQKERQAVFESEFRHDLEDFKRNGLLPKLDHDVLKRGSTLEEIVLDVDDDGQAKDALEEFLND